MSKKIMVAIAAVLVLCGAWYFGSPRWTLYQMRSAAEAKNADKLASYIDFPSLRDSLKKQMKAQLAAKTLEADDGFAALGALFAANMVDGLIDGMITPDSMRLMFDRAETADAGKQVQRPMGMDATQATFERTGFSAFRLHTDGKKNGGALEFHREGLGWKLAAIQLPADALAD